MTIRIGNAPCSWGVEFANDPRNPTWAQVLAAVWVAVAVRPRQQVPEPPTMSPSWLLLWMPTARLLAQHPKVQPGDLGNA